MKALVTGGGGFLGGAIIRQLVARGDEVRSFSRGDYPELGELGVEHVQGDIANPMAVLKAGAGVDIIFHVAARAGVWGPYDAYYNANVRGTENVLRACHKHRIPRLVYTSSPSVIFDGSDMEGVDETAPYPRHYKAHYPQTKMLAEKRVLNANCAHLGTVALRPHLIWGPGDNHLVPRIIERGRAGMLRKLGKKEKRIDSVYIDDAARAHLLAGDRVAPGSPIAGKAYFITQGEPVPIWDLVNKILSAADLPPVSRSIHPRAAYCAGWVLECAYKLLRKKEEPRMTRFLAKELSTSHWFDLSAARRDLDYAPSISIDEGIRRLRHSLGHAENS